ncbi:DoxX family protein [Mucilaginibacter sp. PAMC 26640]|nr:DoxX family protein [Mucilaginibacter sp. PAMC 26640]
MAYFSSLNKYRDFGILIARIGLGAMFVYHGYPKLIGGPAAWAGLGASTRYVGIHFLPVVWGFLAAVTEAVGGALIMLGLAFRPVCLLLVVNLMVAAAMHFGKGDGMDGAAHAVEDAIMFVGLFFIGPGKYSVDKK